MVQMSQEMPRLDDANAWPYGIDPRNYNLGQYDYETILREHREREHAHIMHEQHDAYCKRMDWEAAERSRQEVKLQPAVAFFKFFGFAFWLVVWFFVVGNVVVSLGDHVAKWDAQRCLADVAKCQKLAGPGYEVR